jgi:hypothetical protein
MDLRELSCDASLCPAAFMGMVANGKDLPSLPVATFFQGSIKYVSWKKATCQF